MDKETKDRLTIGVREWAVGVVLGDKWIGQNLVEEARKGGTAAQVIEMAAELEEYVLKGVTD